MKVDKKKLSGAEIRAFKELMGFGDSVEEDFEEDLDLIQIPDYDEIYTELKLSQKFDNMFEDFKTEPLEESEEERINREADELVEKKFNKVYDFYCGRIKSKYGSLDEGNIPLDEDILNITSCKYNCDVEPFVTKLKERMAKNRG